MRHNVLSWFLFIGLATTTIFVSACSNRVYVPLFGDSFSATLKSLSVVKIDSNDGLSDYIAWRKYYKTRGLDTTGLLDSDTTYYFSVSLFGFNGKMIMNSKRDTIHSYIWEYRKQFKDEIQKKKFTEMHAAITRRIRKEPLSIFSDNRGDFAYWEHRFDTTYLYMNIRNSDTALTIENTYDIDKLIKHSK